MILLIDNYDSFSYNLYQLVGSIRTDIVVIRNDEKTIQEIEAMNPELIVLSPGPKRPKDAGVCIEAVRYFRGKIPIFGVCLGHQAICEAYGATITYAKQLMHGKESDIHFLPESLLFQKICNKDSLMKVGRYHSLIADKVTIPDKLNVIATSKEGEVMAVEDSENLVFGVQFHPESVLTKEGKQLIETVLDAIKENGKENVSND